jgi:cytidylate kinase
LMSEERLQKILARAGLGSRRNCERLITGGHVTVDGHLTTELGATADPESAVIRVDGQVIQPERQRYVMLNKPAGYLSNSDPRSGYPSWHALVSLPERLFPVGRLDLDSEGLLLLTNDGELAQQLMHPKFEHQKTYLVQVAGLPTARKVRRLQHGILLDDGPTAPAEVTLMRELPADFRSVMVDSGATRRADNEDYGGKSPKRTSWLKISLREGRKRQLRRMVARVGHPALRVVRIRMGPLELGRLPVGKWRELWPSEVLSLRSALRLVSAPSDDSSMKPAAGSQRARKGPRPSKETKHTQALATVEPPRIIALDGPSASGKSTVGRLLAARLGYLYFDTGVLYRALAYVALKRGVSLGDATRLTELARKTVLEVLPPTVSDGRDVTVLADGVDITWDIRSQDVERAVSPVSAFAGVREVLFPAQRHLGLAGLVVMVGRDIGTVVLPEADLKIYLEASLSVRGQRRLLERRSRGEDPDPEEVLADMRRRDEIDSTRAHGPLTAAPDAIVIDTTSLTIDEVVERVMDLVTRKRRSN